MFVKIPSVRPNGSYNIITSGSANVFSNLHVKDFQKGFLLLDTTNRQKISFRDIALVFNQISDADTHKKTLEKLGKINAHLRGKLKILNPPHLVQATTRDAISQNLQEIPKFNVPQTIKFQPTSHEAVYHAIKKHGFVYPVIFRQAGDHGGVSTVLLESRRSDEILFSFALDGRDYYLTQYVDYSEGGIYKKYRIVVVGGKAYIRHCIISDEWLIHAASQDKSNRQTQIEEMENFNQNIKENIQPIIDEIYKRVGLDYFGIDCSIDSDMRIVLFELNANMNILIGAKLDTRAYVSEIKKAIVEMIESHL